MAKVVCWAPYAKAFEQSIATLLRADFPAGWIAQDVYVGEEQIDVLAIATPTAKRSQKRSR